MKQTIGMLCLLVGMLSGCATMERNVIQPEVYLAGVQAVELGLLEQRVRVDLNVVNPNRFGITVAALDFVLNVNDERLASGMLTDAVTIPGRGERTVSVTARTGVVQIIRQLLRLPRTQSLRYQLTGQLELGRFVGRTFPFDFEGELSGEDLFNIVDGG